ncbi:MAG TPA: DUF2855 family protein [Aquihabitans sp.]|nr:DUF2855 family protein [Aquihabitans sp.]
MTTNAVLEVDRSRCGETRVVEQELEPLGPGQVRLRVDRFALTANNVTYAVLGDMLGYWDFFPTGDPAWGRVPAMGWADVVESTHPDIATGGRCYGWFPMARFADLTASPTADGLRDDGDHRQAHAPVYRSYVDTARDAMYPGGATGDDLGDAEDRHALLRGLFLTSFLADTALADADHHGADAVVVLSASAKTAIGFAQRTAERGVRSFGVTSPGNVDFVRSLGWYTDVLTYDDIPSLPQVDAVSVDISGDGRSLAAVHDRFGDHLKHSMVIGKSHHDAPMAEVTAGPTPEFFFAPTEVSRRIAEWGADGFRRRSAEALEEFVAGSHHWLAVERSSGPASAAATWSEVFDGAVAPSTGRIVSLHE